MIVLSSFQVNTIGTCDNENVILTSSGDPVASWKQDGDLKVRLSKDGLWYTIDDVGVSPSNDVKIGLSSNGNYLLFYLSLTTLRCLEYDFTNSNFRAPVTVATGVDIFEATRNAPSITVAYTQTNKIYTATRDEDSKVWNTGALVVTETGSITDLSIDGETGYTAIAYSIGDEIDVYQSVDSSPFSRIISTGVLANVNLRSVSASSFDLVYTESLGGGNNSIEHVRRDIYVDWATQIVDATNDNNNVDLYSESLKAYVVWVEGGKVRYRERADDNSWSNLVGSTEIDTCDADSEPKILFYASYARVLYKKSGDVYYAGMTPNTQNIVGNFGASSWGGTKHIDNSATAIRSSLVENRISQRIIFTQKELSIGGVSCYLKNKSSDADVTYTLYMDIYYSDISANPYSTPLATTSIASSAIPDQGWAEFDFNLSDLAIPLDGYCFVMSQVGGDENNYASWLSFKDGGTGSKVSNDETTWDLVNGFTRGIMIKGNFDPYANIINVDPAKITNELVTPPAVLSTVKQIELTDLNEGLFDGTKLVNFGSPAYGQVIDQDERISGYTGTDEDWRVVLSDKNLILSFVVDSSGSCGWNDVFGLRKSLMNKIIARLKTKTTGQILFDFVKYGGMLIDDVSVNLTKKVRGVIASIDDVKSVSGFDSDGNPIDSTINPREHLRTGVIAYGYKALKTGTTYQARGVKLGWKDIFHRSVESNWHDFWKVDSPTLSVATNGPESETVLNIALTDSAKDATRFYAANSDDDSRSFLETDLASGSLDTEVFDSTGFEADRRINVLDKDSINTYFIVESVDSVTDIITAEQQSNYSLTAAGAVVETIRPLFVQSGWEATDSMEFFIKDGESKGAIIFFIQCLNGAHMEWEVTPLAEWSSSNLYFIDETAKFDVDAVNSQGENLPDGTLVEFYVDKPPPLGSDELTADGQASSAQASYDLSQDALDGSSVIYLGSTAITALSRNDKVEIIDSNKTYTSAQGSGGPHYSFVSEINADDGYIIITDSLEDDFLTVDSAKLVFPATEIRENDFPLKTEIDIHANIVNVTPTYIGRELDSGLYDGLDKKRSAVADGYDDHNADNEYVYRDSAEMLTTDGYSALRILPVTEDNFLSKDLKEAAANSIFGLTDREKVNADAEPGGLESEDETAVALSSDDDTAKYFEPPADFVMDHRVSVFGGEASTTMKSFASELYAETINGRTYLAKSYEVYTAMTFFKENGNILAQSMLPSFTVSFASPIRMGSEINKTTTYSCPPTEHGEEESNQIVSGTFATDEDSVVVTYNIDDRDFPLPNGVIEVYVYDGMRDEDNANVTDDDIGEPNGCDDKLSSAGGTLIYVGENSTYDSDISKYLLADSYLDPFSFESKQTLVVDNGVATLTLPAIDRVAKFVIHAVYEIEEGKRVVHEQTIYYRSPLVIEYTGPTTLVADGSSVYNLSASLEWRGTDNVDDGTIVNFSASGGDLTPSVSETVSNIASGVEYHPNLQYGVEIVSDDEEAQSLSQNFADRLSGEESTESRSIVITATYQGFSGRTSATLNINDTEDGTGDFFFYCSVDPAEIYSDGEDPSMVVADLQESTNRGFPFIEVVGEDLVESNIGCLFNGPGITVENRLARWTDDLPPDGSFATPDDTPWYAWNRITANEFIGRPKYFPPGRPGSPPACNSPACVLLNVYTRSQKFNSFGRGIDSFTVSFLSSTITGVAKIPKPRIELKEPLGIDVSFEPIDRTEYQTTAWRSTPLGTHPSSHYIDEYNHPIRRDGSAKHYVVAEITWKDKYIVGTAQNPLPKVTFTSGELDVNSENQSYDVSFTENDDYSLDTTEAQVSIARTSFDESHYHVCYVDANGKGLTTETIVFEKGVTVADHVHAIDLNAEEVISYEVFDKVVTNESGSDVEAAVNHTHSPRAVAIISTGSTSDISLPIAVKGEVTYDNGVLLNNGKRVVRTLENYALSKPEKKTDSGSVFTEQYFLEIIPPQQKVEDGLVPGILTSTNKSKPGHTIAYHAWKQDDEGNLLPLPDGTRILTSFKFYEPEATEGQTDNSTSGVINVEQSIRQDYAIMEVNARITGLPIDVTAKMQIIIQSDTNWFPYINNPIFDKPTADSLYLTQAIDSLTEFGASQMNDALAQAASRLITAEETYAGWVKAVVLISNGSENTSDVSYSQAAAAINSIDGDGEVPIFAIKLADTDSFDTVVMQKMSKLTSGEMFKIGQIVGTVDATATAVVNSILALDKFNLLSGKYTNTVDLGEDKYYETIKFNVLLEAGTSIKFRVRFSVDNVTFGEWVELDTATYSDAIGNIIQTHSIDLSSITDFSRYMQYEATMFGNVTTFKSPQIQSINTDYYEPGEYVLFFQPIELEGNDEFIGEIIFVHEGTVPTTSSVKYGLTHDITSDFNSEYSSTEQPLFSSGRSAIVLSWVNEKTTTVDYKNYYAINGRWNDSYEVDVYRVSEDQPKGIIVPDGDYSVENAEGLITFISAQPISNEFNLVIKLNPYFKPAIEMRNFKPESVVLDNVSFIYNVVDKNDLFPANDHRDVTGLVETDVTPLGSLQGTLDDGFVVSNANVGSDQDISIDFAEVRIDDNNVSYFWLLTNSTGPYVVEMLTNLTKVVTHTFTDGPTYTPISMSFDEDNWYLVERTSTGLKVHKYDSLFNFIVSSVHLVGFLKTDDSFKNIRRFDSKWYVTESDRLHILNQSFTSISEILLPVKTSGPFSVDSENAWIVSSLKDVVFGVTLSGASVGYYDANQAVILNNLSRLSDLFYKVKDQKIIELT